MLLRPAYFLYPYHMDFFAQCVSTSHSKKRSSADSPIIHRNYSLELTGHVAFSLHEAWGVYFTHHMDTSAGPEYHCVRGFHFHYSMHCLLNKVRRQISNQYPDKIAAEIINIKTATNDRLDDLDNKWDNDCSQQ